MHWLITNFKKGFLSDLAESPEKVSLGTMGGGKGWVKPQIALTCVCMPYLGHMQGLHNLP